MLSDKKLKKIERNLGQETMSDIESMPVDALKDTLVSAEHFIAEAERELEANQKYQELKASLGTMSIGMREVRSRQNAIIQYCLHILEEKGAK